jgi:selenocysteine-specific elongation factor
MNSDRQAKLFTFIDASGERGLTRDDLAARTGWDDLVLETALDDAVNQKTIINAEGFFLSAENFSRLCDLAVEEVKRHHQGQPLSRGLARETLRERLFTHTAPEIFRAVISSCEQSGLLASEKDLVRAKEHSVELSDADARLRAQLSAAYEKAGLAAPSLEQVLQDAGVAPSQRTHARKVLQLLIDNGSLVRVQGEMFFNATSLDQLRGALRKFASEHEPERSIDVSTFKDLAGVSRKYAIPLLEYFDREHVTRRAGDKRVIL